MARNVFLTLLALGLPRLGAADAIDALVAEAMAADRVPGVALAVVEGEELAFFRGYGRATAAGGPPALDTPFLVGSLSKSFTALVVMQLHLEGGLDVDAPVVRYLPWFRTADDEAWKRVTVRHLLHQTSGLDPRSDRSLVPATPTERVRALSRSRLLHEPGSAFRYANPNYAVLGLVAEAAAGKPFAELVRERVYEPLGMRYGGAQVDAVPDLAVGYQLWFGWPVSNDPPPQSGLAEGGLVASAGDLARYAVALGHAGRLEGRQALPPAAVAAVQEPGVALDAERAYGMGWYRRPLNGMASVSHGGSTPGYGAFVARFPEQDRAVIVLANSWGAVFGGGTPRHVAVGVASLLAGREPPEMGPGAAVRYRWLDLAILVVLAFEALGWWRMRAFRRRLAAREDARGRLRWGLPRGLWHVAASVALLIAVPWYFAFPLRAFLAVPFDLGVLLLVGCSLGILKGLVELSLTVKSVGRHSSRSA